MPDRKRFVTAILRPADKVLLGVILAAGLLSLGLPIFFGKNDPGSAVEIRGCDGWRERWRLAGTHFIKVHGPLGETIVEINDGTVRVLSSPCPMKICMKMGTRSHAGEIIVCVPNQVIIIIEGHGKKLDGITY